LENIQPVREEDRLRDDYLTHSDNDDDSRFFEKNVKSITPGRTDKK